ncbi:MAG TPA: PAS domain S-box protein, partial [Polyangiaceae bacterium]
MGEARVARALGVRRTLGAFFERTKVPTIVVEHDGHFASANDAALAQYGYSLDELVEMRIQDLIVGPRPQTATDLDRAFRGDAAPLDRRPHRRRDGTVLWVVPVAGPVEVAGETLIVSALQDVTPLVSVEERSAVVWEAAVERFGRSFALLDGERRIVRLNRTLARGLHMREEDVLGKRCDEVFRVLCARQPCPHAMAAAERRRIVGEIVSLHGQPLRVEVWPSPPNDGRIATIHVAHDLTEERAMRSRLAAADRLANLGRVAAGVAHEVNNP